MNKNLFWFTITILAFSVAMRLLPHAPNFVPIGALALFAGVYLPKRWGLVAPLAAMFISDLFIGFYDLRLMAVVYGSFAVMVSVGWLVRREKSFATGVFGVFFGSVFFFIATNFAAWLLSDWYAPTFDGLMFSYTLALPFFRSSLLGNLFYSGVFFGVYAIFPVLSHVFESCFRRRKILACYN
jgi:hypothetical protein